MPIGSAQNLSVSNYSKTTCSVTWGSVVPEKRNGVLRGYYVEYTQGITNPQPSRAAVFTCDSEPFVVQLKELKPHKVYSILVRGFNSKGVGPHADPLICTTEEEGTRRSLLEYLFFS